MSLWGEDAEIECPVTPDVLAKLYKADGPLVAELVAAMSPLDAARLAIFCYGRAHLRDMGLKIAAGCDPRGLIQIAGVLGSVLSEQSRNRKLDFGRDGAGRGRGPSRVTLAKAAA